MSAVAEARATAVAATMDDIRVIEAEKGVTREGVEAILTVLDGGEGYDLPP